MNPLHIHNANVVDVARGLIHQNRDVVLKGDRIDSVTESQPGRSGQTIDAAGLYICPGLIDCHAHFFLDASGAPRTSYIESDDGAKMECAKNNARIAIQAGITTMRDCAAPARLMFPFQRQVERGEVLGPPPTSSAAATPSCVPRVTFTLWAVRSAQ